MASKRTLHIDVCLNRKPRADLLKKIEEWLFSRYSEDSDAYQVAFPNNQIIRTGISELDEISSIHINGDFEGREFIKPTECTIQTNLYTLYDKIEAGLPSEEGENDNVHIPSPSCLPNVSLEELWEHLIFEPRIQDKILTSLVRIISIKYSASQFSTERDPGLSLGVFLFWGPPGSGKTSLCKAIAQMLSIRIKHLYTSASLLQLDSHSLYSKYFSESARIVCATLRGIERMLDREPHRFLIILVDEVESLASCREQSISGSEPKDALRAVNALLTGLDRLRLRSNLVVFCTSNLKDIMDTAFLDRVDFKWHIPNPCYRARFEILYQRLRYLGQMGWVTGSPENTTLTSSSNRFFMEDPSNGFPDFKRTILTDDINSSLTERLWNITKRCSRMSGRSLQRLPTLSLAMHCKDHPCSIEEALEALEMQLDHELSIL